MFIQSCTIPKHNKVYETFDPQQKILVRNCFSAETSGRKYPPIPSTSSFYAHCHDFIPNIHPKTTKLLPNPCIRSLQTSYRSGTCQDVVNIEQNLTWQKKHSAATIIIHSTQNKQLACAMSPKCSHQVTCHDPEFWSSFDHCLSRNASRDLKPSKDR